MGKPLTIESRQLLFEWKNGFKLSAKKMASVEKYYPLPGESKGLNKYLNQIGSGRPIWNIFYMHCVTPEVWPIFDQHTFRAVQFIRTGRIEEIPKRDSKIFTYYQSDYIPFIKKFGSCGRKIDKALYSFGRFLNITNRYSGSHLVPIEHSSARWTPSGSCAMTAR